MNSHRLCTKCNEYKENNLFFYKAKNKNTGFCKKCKTKYDKEHYLQNRESHNLANKKYRANNKEKLKEYRKSIKRKYKDFSLIRLYGVTLLEYEKMYEDQKGRCKICENEFERLSIDHDHNSGKIRGLLCGKCNLILGQINDDIFIVESMKKYLEKNS